MQRSSRALVGVIASDFDRIAELYEKLQAQSSDRASQKLVKLAKISKSQSVLDIGTGTGSGALAAARLVGMSGSATGIDVSRGMLSVARRKAVSDGLSNVRFEEMDASSLDFDDDSFDVVISNLGIPTYRFNDAVSEAFRVLRNAGILCFAEFTGLSPAWSSLSKVLSKYAVERPPPELLARREARKVMASDAAKFRLSSFTKVLKSVGFIRVRNAVYSFKVTQPPSEIYLQYLITREQMEYDAMPEDAKRQFREEMLKRLEAIRTQSSGKLERHVRYWIAEKPKT